MEILNVARHDHQPVDNRCGRNECISFIAAIWYVQMGTPRRNRIINRYGALSKLRPDPAIHPSAQAVALLNVAALDAEYPALKLQNCYRRNVQIPGILRTYPSPHIRIGFTVADLSKF